MITFKDVNLSFDNKKIFNQISFNIKKGEKIVISGKSGLGKSSLFHLILGFTLPDQGKVLFNGRPIDEKNIWDIRKKIAFVDQDVSIGKGNVRDWIRSVFELKANFTKIFPQQELQELLNYFEIPESDLNKDIENLSGGERQRLAIIMAVLLKREVFLFDEITSALDKNLKEKTVDYFMRNKNWTLIVISHDSVWLKHPGVKIFNLEEKTWQP